MTSIRFQLSRPRGQNLYRPGDTVSGLVVLNLSHDAAQNAKRIEVAFSGRSEINCTVRHAQYGRADELVPWHGNGRTIFFDEMQTVCEYDQAHLPVPGESYWPFSFRFPSVSSPNQRLRRWGASINLPTTASEPDLSLPPSFHQKHDDWPPTGSPGVRIGTKGWASIIYELEARLVTVQGTFVSHSNWPLTFLPYNRLPASQPSFTRKEQPIRYESRRLLPNVDQASFRSRAKSLMQKAPVSAFKLFVEVPTFAVAGEAFALQLGVDYDFENSTVEDLPPVYLRGVEIGYLDKVRLGLNQPVYTTDRVQTLQSPHQRKLLQYKLKKNAIIRITERMDLRHCLPPDALLIEDLSFETLNIKRSFHDLFVAVVVVCAGAEFSVSMQRGKAYPFIASAAPPTGIELPDSRPLPPEAHGEVIYEAETKIKGVEIGGEPVHELENSLRSAQLQGNPVYELSSYDNR